MAKTNQSLMTIGQAAKASGLAATALRFYEREGLLAPTSRSRAGHRLYDAEVAERLQFIRSAQAIGFTLKDIRMLLELQTDDRKSRQSRVRRLLEARLGEVDERLKDLKRVRAVLGNALDRCRRSSGECAVLKDLAPSKGQRKR